MVDKQEVKKLVRQKYGEIAVQGKESGGCCCSSDCCGGSAANAKETAIKLGYSEADLANAPPEANMGLGCGNPLALAALKEGEVVLDLGCGGGFDCFLARAKVGETGYVIGVDMTPEMVELARQNAQKAGYTNVEFRLGEIEHLPVADESVDVIISNCVINLSPDKEQVFKEAYRVLKPGGRICISDIVATAEIPEHIKQDPTMLTACLAGAERVENIRIMLEKTGFKSIKLTPQNNSREILKSWLPGSKIEDLLSAYIIEATK